MIRFLFKQPKPRQFELKPRFYNERKEYIEARTEAIRREKDAASTEAGGEAFRSRLARSWKENSGRQERSRSNRTVVIFAVLLFALAYYLLYT